MTIAHPLAMASGIRYDGSGSGGGPFQDDAKTYYDPNLRALAVAVRAAGPPGVTWLDPQRAVVVVRLGERRGDVDGLTLAREVAAQVR